MKLFKLLPTLLASSIFAVSQANASFIDTFDDPVDPEQTVVLTGVTPLGQLDAIQQAGSHASIFGGFRDLILEATGSDDPTNPFDSSGTVDADDSALKWFNGDVTTTLTVQWDGDDSAGTVSELATTGLNGLDLASGGTGVYVDVLSADMKHLTIDFTAYDMNGNNATNTYTFGSDVTSVTTIGWSFDSFAGVDFGNIGALEMVLSSSELNMDTGISSVKVPEPSAAALLGLGLVGLVIGRRRARK